MTSKPVRHFVTLGQRQLHLRMAGRGSPVLMLHRAPTSSVSLESLILEASGFATVIAPDLPGYGNSDPMDGDASIEAYAADLLQLCNRLGIKRFALFGEQVGAMVAASMSAQAPDRVSLLVLRDLPSPSARATIPPALVPEWTGSHLADLWAFLREDAMFAPYNARRLDNRILAPLADAGTLHQRLVDVLRAPRQGRDLADAFRAASDHDPLPDLLQASSPVEIIADLAGKEWIPPADWARARVHAAGSGAEARQRTITLLKQAATQGPDICVPATQGVAQRLASRMVDVPGGQMHARFNDDAGTIPLVIQHDAASSSGTVEPIAASLIGKRSVLVPDLPGSGESDNLIGDNPSVSVADYADHVAVLLGCAGLDQVDFYGMWGGGFVGSELALNHPGRVRRLVMSNLFFHEGAERRRFQEHYTPAIEPVWHGGHLLQAWHQMRDQGLFFPWFDKDVTGIIRREPFLDTAMVHERVCSLLKAGSMYRTAYQAHFVYPTFERVAALRIPALLATAEWDPNRPHTEEVAATSSNCSFRMLDPDFRLWGLSCLSFLEARQDPHHSVHL